MACTSGPAIIDSGIVLHLDIANIRSYPGTGTIWSDLSGNGNNGTLVNGVGYNSANKGAIIFDGVNDLLSFNYIPPNGINPRTISIWFNPSTLQNKNLLGYGTPSFMQMWDILLYNGTVGVHLYNSSAEAPALYQVGQWQNIVFTFNYPTITSFMNGVQQNSYSNTNINTGAANSLSISKGVYAPFYYFNGSVSQVSIHNRALSAAEIKQNFEATRGRYGI